MQTWTSRRTEISNHAAERRSAWHCEITPGFYQRWHFRPPVLFVKSDMQPDESPVSSDNAKSAQSMMDTLEKLITLLDDGRLLAKGFTKYCENSLDNDAIGYVERILESAPASDKNLRTIEAQLFTLSALAISYKTVESFQQHIGTVFSDAKEVNAVGCDRKWINTCVQVLMSMHEKMLKDNFASKNPQNRQMPSSSDTLTPKTFDSRGGSDPASDVAKSAIKDTREMVAEIGRRWKSLDNNATVANFLQLAGNREYAGHLYITLLNPRTAFPYNLPAWLGTACENERRSQLRKQRPSSSDYERQLPDHRSDCLPTSSSSKIEARQLDQDLQTIRGWKEGNVWSFEPRAFVLCTLLCFAVTRRDAVCELTAKLALSYIEKVPLRVIQDWRQGVTDTFASKEMLRDLLGSISAWKKNSENDYCDLIPDRVELSGRDERCRWGMYELNAAVKVPLLSFQSVPPAGPFFGMRATFQFISDKLNSNGPDWTLSDTDVAKIAEWTFPQKEGRPIDNILLLLVVSGLWPHLESTHQTNFATGFFNAPRSEVNADVKRDSRVADVDEMHDETDFEANPSINCASEREGVNVKYNELKVRQLIIKLTNASPTEEQLRAAGLPNSAQQIFDAVIKSLAHSDIRFWTEDILRKRYIKHGLRLLRLRGIGTRISSED